MILKRKRPSLGNSVVTCCQPRISTDPGQTVSSKIDKSQRAIRFDPGQTTMRQD